MFNLDDPKVQALLMAAGGLLTPTRARGGAAVAEGVSRGIQGGLLGYQQGVQARDMSAQRDMQRRMQEAQLGDLSARQAEAQARQAAMGRIAQANPQLADLFAVAPDKAISRAFPEPQKPKMGFAPNGQAVDMNALEPGKDYGKAPDWQNPKWVETQMALRRAGAPSVSVGMPAQENSFQKEYGKTLAESYGNLMKSDISAASTLNNLSRLESLLKSAGKTGPLAPTLTTMKAVVKQLGGDIDAETDYAKAASALSNQLALELRNPAGGAGMPGALSDKDREFLVGMTAGIHQLPNANAMIIETRRRMAKREREVAKMARDYRKRTGRFDEGFYQELAQYSEANPLFGDLIGPTGAANGAELSPQGQAVFNKYMAPQ